MGCMGFLRPESPPWQIRRAVEAVASGELWAPRLLLSQMCREYLSSHDPCKLTGREEEILALLAQGHKNREIAASLFISRDTVRWHMRAIYAKLGIHDRRSAASYATGRSLKPITSVMANSHQSLAI
jgi:DNA-binding NarL/FixJ family response regulator